MSPESQYGQFPAGYREILENQRQKALRFNIFSILKLHAAEARTHTPLLAHLLDPRAEHGQEELFYRHFLKVFYPEKAGLFTPSDYRYLWVQPEKYTGQGFIDILIECRQPEQCFALIVENKVYAADQDQQLERYYKYVRDRLGYAPERIGLIYLTAAGKEPDVRSISPILKRDLKTRGLYVHATYQGKLAAWLETCLREVRAPRIKSILEQYLMTINRL